MKTLVSTLGRRSRGKYKFQATLFEQLRRRRIANSVFKDGKPKPKVACRRGRESTRVKRRKEKKRGTSGSPGRRVESSRVEPREGESMINEILMQASGTLRDTRAARVR